MAEFQIGMKARRICGHSTGSEVRRAATVVAIEDNGDWLIFDDHTQGYACNYEPLPVADATEEAVPLKIEEGKYYRTRDGRKVGPAVPNHIAPISYPWNIPYDGAYHAYEADGTSCIDDNDDVVAEWSDEPAVVADQSTPASTNDNQAPTTLNFNTTDANAKLDEIIAKLKLIDEMASELGISFTTQQAA